MDVMNFAKDLMWGLAAMPYRMVFGTSNQMHSNVLRKINPYVVITSCDSGIGMLTAIHLQHNNFQVIAICDTDEGVERVKNEVKMAIKMDITKDRDIETVYRRTTELLSRDPKGRLWALINNPAPIPGSLAAPIEWVMFDDFRRALEADYLGAVHMTKMFLPLLKTTPSSRVINISGLPGMLAAPSMNAYAPAMHALEAFSKQLELEIRQFDVHVVVVELPLLRTPMVEQLEDNARSCYDRLSDDMKRQYPREDAETYIRRFGSCIRSKAQDPIRGVRMIMQAIRAQIPEFKYAPSRFMGLALLDWMLPMDVKMLMYSYAGIPKALPQTRPLPVAAAS